MNTLTISLMITGLAIGSAGATFAVVHFLKDDSSPKEQVAQEKPTPKVEKKAKPQLAQAAIESREDAYKICRTKLIASPDTKNINLDESSTHYKEEDKQYAIYFTAMVSNEKKTARCLVSEESHKIEQFQVY